MENVSPLDQQHLGSTVVGKNEIVEGMNNQSNAPRAPPLLPPLNRH